MIVINSHVFAIEPKDSRIMRLFIEELDDPDHVEIFTRDYAKEDHKPGVWDIFTFSLETAEMVYRGIAVWVCPD